MSIVLVLIITFILLLLFVTVVVLCGIALLIEALKHFSIVKFPNDILELLKIYFKAKREFAYFFIYFSLLTGLIEMYAIPNLTGFIAYRDEDMQIIANLKTWGENSEIVFMIIAVLATLAYFGNVYFRLRKMDFSKISHTADLIANEFEFRPNDCWFQKVTEKAIKDLGRRYNETQNYPYKDTDLILSSLKRDKSTQSFIESAFEDVYEKYTRCKRWSSNKDISNFGEIAKAVEDILKCLCGDCCTIGVVNTVIEKCKHIDELVKTARKDWYRQNGHQTIPYDLNDFSKALGEFEQTLKSPWIAGIESIVMIVKGKGGIGKSHLLADIANKRISEREPTLLCLGMHITTDEDPLIQIMSHMDVRCKKEVFLQGLNNYGKRVVIIVDGINEGKGISLWKNHLDSSINEISQYSNVQLVISYRSSASQNFFNDYAHQKGYPEYEHKGFEDNPCAIEYMFYSYGISLPTFPFFGEMFSNPMFLTLYCRSHELSGKMPDDEDRWGIVKDYVYAINRELAKKQGYMEDNNLVELCLLNIADAMIDNGIVYLAEAQQIVNKTVASYTKDASSFLQSLIEEGLLMIQESYDSQKHIEFGYDTVKDIYLAYCLVSHHEASTWFNSSSHIYDYPYLAYFAPMKEGRELFEYVESKDRQRVVNDYCLPVYSWQKNETESWKRVVASLMDSDNYEAMFELCIKCAHRKDLSANAAVLTNMLMAMDFRKRDAVWTTRISSELSSEALRITQWGWGVSESAVQKIRKEELELACELLVWCLASTNLMLRDCATKALVNLLCDNTEVLCSLIEKFHDLDDFYIKERLWAVVMGCSLNNNDKDKLTRIAQLTYEKVFATKEAEQHFLLREYAAYTIEYALKMGCRLNIDIKNIERPYNTSSVIPVFPTTDYVNTNYVEDYKSVKDKHEWGAKNRILESMITEYSSRGMYGDFGRYVFQGLMDEWDYDPELLSNWALKIIFEEMGYDAHTFADFDTRKTRGDRAENEIERIGKKYQWIAMYKIMAIIDDAYQGESKKEDWMPSIVMRARNIDPTIRLNPKRPRITRGEPIYKCPTYDFSEHNKSRKHWNSNYKKMPDISLFITCSDSKGDEWINLFSYNTIKSSLTQKDDRGFDRELWVFLQSMIVDKKDLKPMLKAIRKDGLRGRHSTENRECMCLFYREYYWSDLFRTEVQETDWTHRPYRTSLKEYANIVVEPTYLIYEIESSMDKSFSTSQEFLMPSSSLYKGMNMAYNRDEGCWNDATTGTIVCFDNSITRNGKPALLIRKSMLLDYLKKENRAIVWPILMERSTSSSLSDKIYSQAGGYVWMDCKGKLHHNFRLYEPNRFDKVKSRLSSWKDHLHQFCVKRGWRKDKDPLLMRLEELSRMEIEN